MNISIKAEVKKVSKTPCGYNWTEILFRVSEISKALPNAI